VVAGIGYDDASSPGPERESKEATITGNAMFAHTDAIRFESSARGTITGNLAITARPADVSPQGGYTAGILVRTIQESIRTAQDVVVSGNVIQWPQYGLVLHEVKNVVVSGNVIRMIDEYEQSYSGNRIAVYILKNT